MQEGLAEVMGASLTLAMSRKSVLHLLTSSPSRRRKGRPTSTQCLSTAITQRGEKLVGSILPLSVSLSVDHRSAGRCAESLSTKLHCCRKGTIYLRLRKRPEAASAFITSLQSYPCNWSAYIGLSSCISSIAELETILPTLPRHPFTTCFEIHTKLDLHSGAERVGELVDELERDVFSVGLAEKGRREGKTWVWGAGQKAMIAYHLRGTCTASLASRLSLRRWLTPLPFLSRCADFDTAESGFDTVQRLDPYRLDDVDTYSNMLYVIPKLSKLAQLAKEYSKIDRNRAETCALIGAPPRPLNQRSCPRATN